MQKKNHVKQLKSKQWEN